MTAAGQERVDIAALRAAYPIEQVIAASGIDLQPRGHGYMGCCPFHDDTTASLSVGGIPDRFKCFGCDAGGDVIEFVARLHHLSFTGAVNTIRQQAHTELAPPAARRLRLVPPAGATEHAVTADRAHDINQLAWQHFSTPVASAFADSYLRRHRGLDLTALKSEHPDQPLVGHAGTGWTSLTARLRSQGVSDDELLATDLAQTTKAGRLIDALRGRLIFPVTNPAGGIQGFIGRDVTGDPRAPKYRNPTRTPTFDKSEALYRPTHHELDEDASVVVVEGVLDALAIAASAAREGQSARFAPCSASGVTASDAQVSAALAIHTKPAVIALDGDPAGAQGTDRWLTAICFQRARIALVSRLPANLDPAEWLKQRGDPGLTAFDRRACVHPGDSDVVPHLPGREVVQLSLARGRDPIRDTVKVLVPLAATLRPRAAAELLNQAEREMTCEGWNPNDAFTKTIRHLVLSAQQVRQAHTSLPTELGLTETSVHRFPTGRSPGFA